METKGKTSVFHNTDVSNVQLNIKFDVCEDKGTKLFITQPIRRKIYELFLSGKKFSVVDLSKLTNSADPRGNIRYIRNAGVPISDYWVNTKFSKYKVYFLK